MTAVESKLRTASAKVDARMPTEAPLEVNCELCRQGISCVDGTYRFHRCRGYVKFDEGYFHNYFPDEDVLTLKVLSNEKWVRLTRSGKFRATEMKPGLVKVYNASYVEIMSFHVMKGRMCDKRRKRVRKNTVVAAEALQGPVAAADALQGPVAAADASQGPVATTTADEDIDNVQDQTDEFIDDQGIADNDFVEYDNDAFMPIETLAPPAPSEASSLHSLPFGRRTTIVLTVFLVLSVLLGVAYNLMHFEAPMVEQMEEINVSEVIEEPVDKPEIETQTIAIEELPGEHQDWLFNLFAVGEAFVLLACMPKLCLGH